MKFKSVNGLKTFLKSNIGIGYTVNIPYRNYTGRRKLVQVDCISFGGIGEDIEDISWVHFPERKYVEFTENGYIEYFPIKEERKVLIEVTFD